LTDQPPPLVAKFALRANLPFSVYNHPSMTVSVRSFAKINLGLRIGAPRADGFHELLTVYQTIGLHDVVRVSVSRGTGIEIRCEHPRVPRDRTNTCFRMVELAVDALRVKGRVLIEIEKRLPVQGGLGGASSNAVAGLLGLERAVRKSLPATERLGIAAAVGSDLPLFLLGGTVLGTGRGEGVFPLVDFPAMACVVVTPEVGISTPQAFAEWDRLCHAGARARVAGGGSAAGKGQKPATLRWLGPDQSSGPIRTGTGASHKLTLPNASDRMIRLGCAFSAWLGESYSGAPFARGRAENPLLALVRAGIENDFERVVFPEYPELSEVKSALKRAGAKYASLSGSGSTLFGLCASRESAVKVAVRLRQQGWSAQPTVTLTRSQYWKKFQI
jgi:4-diphosphocytidyl-2-C-methyl-D-erythritol kinase